MKRGTLTFGFRRLFFLTCLLAMGSLGSTANAQLSAGMLVNGRFIPNKDTVKVCRGTTLTYITATFGATSVNWTFGGGSPASSTLLNANITVSYPNNGIFITKQIVSNVTDFDSVEVVIDVSDVRPVADFNANPQNECANVPVQFTNTSTGNNIIRYNWNFGDGNTSTLTNPTNTFFSAIGIGGTQSFNVTLTATNDYGCVGTVTKPVNVKRIPDATMNSADASVIEGPFNGQPTFRRCSNDLQYTFSFINGSTTLAGNTEYKIEWGDGSPDSIFTSWPTATIIKHTFPAGNSVMTLTIKAADGCLGIKKYNVFVGTTPSGGIASPGNTNICAPQPLTFTLSGTQNNSPGTTYTLNFNDGTPPQLFNHPAPSSYTHTFQNTSCGTTTGLYNNSFTANLLIQNPCGQTDGTVIPIYVSSKPRSRISIAPDSVVCTGTNVTISNVSLLGGFINFQGGTSSTCVTTNRLVWQLVPNTGYTINSGSFGSTNNSSNFALWTSGSNSFNVTFNQPGNYQVKLLIANNCGIDSVIRTICVRNPPQASFTMSAPSGCGQTTVTMNNTTPVGSCIGNRYSWAVQYLDPLGCGSTTSNFQFVNGTNASSINPQIQFNQPGRYVVRLTAGVNSNFVVCTSTVRSDTFTIKAKPKVAINPPGSICVNNSITPTANVSNCYGDTPPTYAWTFNNGTPSTSTNANPGAINYTAIGVQPILLSVTNECGTTDVSANVNVTGLPTINAGVDRSICSGGSTPIGSAAQPGFTYSWTPTTGIVNPNAASTTLSLTYSGTANDTTYEYVLRGGTGANCSNTDTVYITVRKSPNLLITPNAATLCAGDTVALAASGADTYLWTPATGLSANNRDSILAFPIVTTTYQLTGTLTNGGCTASRTVTITVRPKPNTQAGRDSTVCVSANAVQLTGTPAGGTWTGTQVTVGGLFNPSAAGLGSYTLTYTATLNGCSKSDSMVITVINQPTAQAGNDTTLCSGTPAVNLVGQPAGGLWSGTGVSPTGIFTPATAGTFTLTYTFGSGTCSAADTKNVLVQPGIANNTLSGNQSICINNAAALITGALPTGGDGLYTYQWQRSNDNINFTNIAGATSADYNPGVLTGTTFFRRLVSTNLCANNTSLSVQITVNQDARALFTASKQNGCAPFVIDQSIITTTPFVDRNLTYSWYANNTLIGSNATGVFPGYTLSTANDSVLIKLVVTARGGCKPDSMAIRFYTPPSPSPSFIQSDTGGCGPITVLFTNTTPNRANFDYLWDFGNGQTTTQAQPNSITFQPDALQRDTIYTIRLKAFKGCDTVTATRFVSVQSKPKALFTPEKTNGCSPFTAVFTNTSRGNNNSYQWIFGDGSAPRATNQDTVHHLYINGSRTTYVVELRATNRCGSDTLPFNLVVNPNTIRLDFAVNGTERTGCLPHTVRFFNNSQGGNVFQWNFGDGATLTTNRNVDTVVHTYTQAGTFTVTLRATNSCSDTSDIETISTLPKPKSAFTVNTSAACTFDTLRFTNQSDTAINYLWRFGDGTTSQAINPSKIYSQSGNYRVWLIVSRTAPGGIACVDSSFRDIVIGGGNANLLFTKGYACINQAQRFEITTTGATQYTFYFGNGDSLQTSSPIVQYTYTTAGIYRPFAQVRYGTCLTRLAPLDTIRVDDPKAGYRYTLEQSCGQTTLRFTDTSKTFFGPGSWRWDFGDGSFSTQQNPLKSYSLPGDYVVRLRMTGISGCTDTTSKLIPIRVQNFPRSAVQGDTLTCSGALVKLQAVVNSADSISSYQWDFGNGFTASGLNVSLRYAQAGTYQVRLISRTVNGCADTVFQRVVVQASPIVRTGNDARICLGQPWPLQATGAINYLWSPATGLSNPAISNPIARPTQTTTYVVIGTAANGCSASDSVTIEVVQPFQVSITGKDTICIGDRTQLFASGAVNYQWSPAIGLSNPNIANPIAQPNSTTQYRVVGTDPYNCFRDTAFIVVAVGPYPTVELGNGTTLVAGTPFTMNPQITNGPIRSYQWTPTTWLSCTNCPRPVATINNNIVYRLEVETQYGCKASDTIGFRVVCDQQAQVFVPNAFSPDGDGLNDVLMVRGKGITTVRYFRVFNRWGQVVFERSNIQVNDPGQGWDGKINGLPAQPDVYVYTAEVQCTAGGTFTYKGNVTLIRVR
jgi:gliding motility-associated-like protein